MDVKESTIAFDHCDSDVNKCEEIMSSKTDRTVRKTGYYLSRALSNYIQFLRDWSSSRTTADTNLLDSPFALRIDIPEDNLGDALPTDRCKEVVQYLKISVNEHYQIQKLHIDTHLKILGDLENMAKTHFQNAATLDTLDLQITLLRAILALLTPSHLERNRPYLKLGEALILRFEHTDELHDLDSAISHYSSAHFDGVDQYFLLQGLTRCLMIRFKSNQNVADLNKAINALEQALTDLPSSHPYRYACLYNLGLLMMERYELNAATHEDTLQQAISYYWDALLLCPTVSDGDLHTLQSIISSFSAAVIKRHEQYGIPIDGEDVVKLLQSFILLVSDTIPEKHDLLSHQLSQLLWIATKNKQYSDEMLSVVRQFVKLKSSSYLKHYFALQALSTMSMVRFGVSKNADDLDEAIAAYRDALHYARPHESESVRTASLNILANMLVNRFTISGAGEDSKEVKIIYHEILGSILDDVRMQNTMQEYADFLVSIFVKHSNPEDIHEAVSLYQAALDLASRNEGQSAYEGDILLRLSQALLLITEKTDKQDEADACIDEAIGYLQASTILLDDGSENLTNARKLLNACLLERYDTKGDPNDLKKFAELTGDDEGLASNIILDLKHTKVVDISNTHDAQELEDMIILFRNTLTKEPFPHPKRPTTLVSLGKALSLLFKFGGSRKQLDEAILHLREAVALLPKSAIALLTLSEVLIQKAMLEEFRSTREYIEEANVHLHKGFHLIGTYPGESDDFIQQMYGRLCGGDLDLLDHVSMIQELNSKNTGNGSSDSLARNMSYLLEMSFEMSGNMKELDDSIYHAREAATAFPENDPQSAALLHDLGHKLVRRYQGLNNLDDLDEALHLYFKSIQVLPPNHYFHSLYLGDFGIALILRLGHIKDMGEMFNILSYVSMLFQTGAMKSTSSPVPDHFRSAKLWALLADTFNHESALEAYEQAISFLPRLSSMATNITARQETFKLSSIDGLSRNAALFAIKIGRYDKAIEFLEAGRAIFWLQSLHLRSPMDRLQNAAPNLHMRLSEISVKLDRASMSMNVSCTPENIAGKQIQDEELFQLEDLNEEWQKTLDEVRELEEFKDFLSPLKISRLQELVGHPVIFLIPGEHQSHALVMSTNEVKHIDLPNAPYDMLQKLAAHLPGSGPRGRFRGIQDELQAEAGIGNGYLAQSDSHERKGGPRHFNHIEDDDKIKHVLEVLWRDVVQLIIVALDPYMNGSPLEVCWCPTGIFSFLPLHAAGIYNDNMSSIESAFDYLISSYSPTVSASTHNEPPSDTTEEFKMMVVVDRENLPNTIHELTAIEKHVDSECLIKMGTQECPALVERAASNLPNVSIVHFACHGMQLKDNPLNSALMLKDGNLKISRIMEERIPNAALAFLCACETAMGVKDLPDEAMHLGATLLFSGFRRVVATMWSIDDEDGPIVADTFYARLFRDDSRRPDTNTAAEAIHAATAVLRERGASFKRWVPFIHLGT